MKIPLTRVAAFRPFPEYLQRNGCEVTRYFASFGIAPESILSEETLFPLHLAGKFIQMVSNREGIDCFGFEAGSRARIREVGIFGKILSQAITLNDLLHRIVRWCPLVDSGIQIWLDSSKEDPKNIRLCFRHEMDVGRKQVDAYGVLIFIDAVRMALGTNWRPRRVALDCAESDSDEDVEDKKENETECQNENQDEEDDFPLVDAAIIVCMLFF